MRAHRDRASRAIARIRGGVILVAVLAVTTGALAGCQLDPRYDPDQVAEYRYFPEYGGFFPLLREDEGTPAGGAGAPVEEPPHLGDTGRRTVCVCGVLPAKTSDGRLDWTAPATAAEAERRLRKEAEDGGHQDLAPGLRLPVAVALMPVGLVLLPLALPVLLFGLAESGDSFADFAGVEVALTVKGRDGRPIEDAQVLEIASPFGVWTFADGEGRRSFAPPEPDLYEVPRSSADAMAEAFFREHGELVGAFEWMGYPFWSGTVRETDDDGEVSWRSGAYWPQVREVGGAEPPWAWRGSPRPVTLFLVFFHHDYAPHVELVENVAPRSELRLEVVLDPTVRGGTGRPESAGPGAMTVAPDWRLRAALAAAERLFPGLPELDNLRAQIALEEGDRARAVRLARYTGHEAYFRLFHERNLIGPGASRWSAWW